MVVFQGSAERRVLLVSRLTFYAEAFDGHNGKPLSDAYPAGHCCRNLLHRWVHYRVLGSDCRWRSFRDRVLDRVSFPTPAFLTELIFFDGLNGNGAFGGDGNDRQAAGFFA